MAVDIRDAAVSVNDRLKKLIIPEDDEDFDTDRNTPPIDSLTLSTRRKVLSVSPSPQSQVTGHNSSTPTPSTLTPSPSHPTSTTRETQDTTKKSDSPKMGRTVAKPGSQSPNTSRKSDPNVSGAKSREGEVGRKGGEKGEMARKEKSGKEIGSELREPRLHLLAVLGVLVPHMKFTLPETRIETLRWVMWLHQQLPKRVRERRGGGDIRGKTVILFSVYHGPVRGSSVLISLYTQVYLQAGKLFPALLEMLTDQSDKVAP